MIPYLVGCESNSLRIADAYPKSTIVPTGDLYTDALSYINDFRTIYKLSPTDKLTNMRVQINAYVGYDISPLLEEITRFKGQSQEEQERYILSKNVISQAELSRIYALGEEIASLGFEQAIYQFSTEVFAQKLSTQQVDFYKKFIAMIKVVHSINPLIFSSQNVMWGNEAKGVAITLACVGGALACAGGQFWLGAACFSFAAGIVASLD